MSRRELQGALSALVRLIDNADDIESVREGTLLATAREVVRREASGQLDNIPWTRFSERGLSAGPTTAQIAMVRTHFPNMTIAEATAAYKESQEGHRIMVNSRYQVAMRDNGEGTVHLSIKRIDQRPIHDWRDLQRIKDELVGPECEAVELYPADSRLVDTSTQYHLWAVRDPTFRFPFGFEERKVIDDDDGGPTAQRRRDP